MAASTRVLESIAEQTGVTLQEKQLFADSLSDDSGPAPSYIAMMRHNANIMLESMRGAA